MTEAIFTKEFMVYHSVYIEFQKIKSIQKIDKFLLGEVGDGREIRLISITKGMGNWGLMNVFTILTLVMVIFVYIYIHTHTHIYIIYIYRKT